MNYKCYHLSDHTYNDATGTEIPDHDYTCNLYGEDDEVEEEENQTQLEQMIKLLPALEVTGQYDIPSVLRTTTLSDIAETDIIMAILNELCGR